MSLLGRTVPASSSEHSSDAEQRAERNNRNLNDLLQELRVVGLGVQMLFGFLLALPFSARFTKLGVPQRDLYQLSLLAAAAATVLLVSPVAFHRWVFRRHEKDRLLKLANMEALMGLTLVAVAICSAVCMVMTVVGGNWIFSSMTALVVAAFVFFWFALPIFDRAVDDLGARGPSEPQAGLQDLELEGGQKTRRSSN